MKFGPLPLDQALGAILGHGLAIGGLRLKKGHVLSADDLEALRAVGRIEVVAARLDPGDVGEDEAADTVARAARGPGARLQPAFTGRANLYAEAHGLAVVDAERVHRLNAIDEAVTIATLPPFEPVEPGQMLATVKIIPFGAPRALVERCAAIAAEGGPLLRVAPFTPHRVGLVTTRLPGMKDSLIGKTEQAVRDRVEALGSTLDSCLVCDHEAAAVAACVERLLGQGLSPVLVFGASAIVDRADAIPAGIVAAGGEVIHFGMPVDPGNLLLLGRVGATPVVGLPGCARSPKVNGFDWVLQRLLAGLPVGRAEIAAMGVGGLLMEIATRPQPRAGNGAGNGAPRLPRIAAVVLAAGRSSRMGSNKMLEEIGGVPMIARSIAAIRASAAAPVVVVLGNQAEAVRAALPDGDLLFVENPDYAAGLSTSLRAGLAALPEDIDGALVCLGDMPLVRPEQIDRLIAAFNPIEGRAIIVPTWQGKRGNPVLFAARFFAEMKAVEGDTGARHLIGANADLLREVPMEDDAVLTDLDTPEALAAARVRVGR